MINYEYTPLEWDSAYFSINSAKIILKNEINKIDEKDILSFLENKGFYTIYNKNNNMYNNYWIGQKTKAFLTDMNIQFSKIINTDNILTVDKQISVSNCFPLNNEILDISKKSFLNSRFLSDPNITNEKAMLIYYNWVKNAFFQENKFFIVYSDVDTNLITGFLLFSMDKDVSTIELIAIDNSSKSKGIGKKLMFALERYLLTRKVTHINVGTQINNLNAINFYRSSGYTLKEVASIYHFWKM